MKAFFISLSFFILILTVTLLNSSYVERTANQMEKIALKIENGSYSNEDIIFLEEIWQKKFRIIELTEGYPLVSSITNRIKSIVFYARTCDSAMLKRDAILLMEDLKDMKRVEKFSLNSIF